MTAAGETTGAARGDAAPDGQGGANGIRLVLIPLIIWTAWLIETFLLEGNRHLFSRADPGGLPGYTIIACILTGTIVPVFIILRSFLTGDVNMFQIGFRTPGRVLSACLGTLIAGYCAVILLNPFGTDRIAFGSAFLLLLPTALASVMVCWVLTGTHVQAYVRQDGSRVSIPVGVVSTALIFGLSSLVHSTMAGGPDTVSWSVAAGLGLALFFFSIRDVYATTIAAAGTGVFLNSRGIDPAYLGSPGPEVVFSAAFSLAVLAGIHWYLFRNYTTLAVPVAKPAATGESPR